MVGVLISLQAPTVPAGLSVAQNRVAGRLPAIFGTQDLPAEWRALVLPTRDMWLPITVAGAALLLLLDGWLISIVLGQFRRSRLLAR